MAPVWDKRYHIYNRFRHFWAEIKKLWNHPLANRSIGVFAGVLLNVRQDHRVKHAAHKSRPATTFSIV